MQLIIAKNTISELKRSKAGDAAAFALDVLSSIETFDGITVFLCDSYASANDLYKNITFLKSVLYNHDSAKKVFFCEEIIPVSLLYALRHEKNAIVILTPSSFFSKVPDPDSILKSFLNIKKGSSFSRDKLIETFVSYGYKRLNEVESENEFAVRGEIIDIFNGESRYPVRMDFFDETVEDMRYFDLNTQRSLKNIDNFTVFPVNPDYYEKRLNILDIAENPVLYVEEPETELLQGLDNNAANRNIFKESLKKAGEIYYYDIKKSTIYHGGENSENFCKKIFLNIEYGSVDFTKKLRFENGSLNLGLIKKIFSNLIKKQYRVILPSKNKIHSERLKKIFESIGIYENESKAIGGFRIIVGDISSGIISKKHKLFMIKDEELFREHTDLTAESAYTGFKPDFLEEIKRLNTGDFVVHDEFGIAKFGEIKKITVKGVSSDYFALMFDGGDKVFVPADKIYLLHKYIASESDNPPQLSRLSSKLWEKAKTKAKKKIEEIAEDLKILYAKRITNRGFAFSEEDEIYREFEEDFEFEETEDQANAIRDVLSDMCSNKPMDRLICGDVGYGKTEVAIRAAFKAAMDGKQVALIAPTTLLVEQHYSNFKKRFEKYPIKIACISRFTRRDEEEKIHRQVKNGEIDIIIGTHKLLSKKIIYRDIGLLIIDEEQKFGALQKEKIKKMRHSIDVLAMSATPIPRTLYLSMSGIRGLSIINTPPAGRKNIITNIAEYQEQAVKDVVFRELNRGGQVYFIDNRISHIDGVYGRLKETMPDIKIGIVHGRLESGQIMDIMHTFYNKGYDVLLSTNIIESGLDNPNVNTIIINKAEQFGLSQLYQLRGRVGRSHIQAYCLLVVGTSMDNLSIVQRKRLNAVRDYSKLGSGFKLAMADLEIRGAGNILGDAQSGHIDAVGLEMCMQMLQEEIEKVKGVVLPVQIVPEVRVNLSAYIPDSYIKDDKTKLYVYRKLSNCNVPEDVNAISSELIDRFGGIGDSVENLLRIAELKSYMRNSKIKLLEITERDFVLEFHESADTIFDSLVRFVNGKEASSEYIINFAGEFKMRLRLKKITQKEDKLDRAKIILQRLYRYVNI
ncbi:transcription-repair coupling factor [Candidatus Acidulodesulfobacterium sp. H_13]|uniref:transcription-repair coupling factor n=1 Tax=Candidatus Acidulodesulfobacterium sp. H_13 TaxID=3395470 RepID=UPI003AF71271